MRSTGARVWAIVSAVARGGVWSTDGIIACTLAFFFWALIAVWALSLAGCGGDPSRISNAPGFEGDLRAVDDGDLAKAQSSLALVGGAPAPRVIYLDYADGTLLPKTPPNACHATAPQFRCQFGASLLECQRKVQAYLDRWYADFNVVFTLTRPTTGAFNTVVVSSGGAGWCGLDSDVAGAAPFLCDNIDAGAVYAFRGGEDAKETAIIMAQEQAHLVGLEHTASDADLMSPTICETCDGFEQAEEPIVADRCNRKTQSSHQMMLDRLGAWPGGPKPSAFGCQADSPSPAIQIVEPIDQSRVGANFSVRVDAGGDCAVARVDVAVAPQVLRASATSPPYRWDLSNISGSQTIVVTATDVRGQSTRRTVSVMASDDGAGGLGGCTVGGRAPAAVGTVVSGLLMVAFAFGRRRGRGGVRAFSARKRA